MAIKLTKKKKIWILAAALSVVLAAAVTAGAIFLPGLLGRSPADPHVRWYSEEKKEYVITTADELYDMAYLSSKYDFAEQTFTLGADIVINEGDAEDWETNAPDRLWYPINGFAGTFDGQGHTISGLYAKAFNENMGLFANTTRHAVIKNLKVTNSYIWNSGEHPTGVITANGAGTFENIYTDAIIWSDNWNNGGIIGMVDVDGDTAITNCWFDGRMTLKSDQGRVAGGIVGDIVPASGVCTITHCLSTGSFSAEAITNTSRGRLMDIGGIVGRATASTTNISDCFANITVDSGCLEGVGDVIGSAGKSTTNISHTYSVSGKGNLKSVGYRYNKTVGDTYTYKEETLKGYGAYKWTTLDFEEFWAVDLDGTPILKTFADEVPSLTGIEREIDDSWYNKRNTYTISTYKQLLALHIITQWDNMSGKTIYLGDDIVVQEGDAATWGETAPEIEWKGLSSANTMFAGIFDGLGHSISGMYQKRPSSGLGLFVASTDGATIRNVKVLNSYFESTNVAVNKQTYSYIGSISAYARGTTFDSCYSNAIMVSDGYFCAGLVGLFRNGKASIVTNCWFDGKIKLHGENTGMRGGGIVGCVWNTTLLMSHCLYTGEMSSESWAWGANQGLLVGYPNAKSVVTIEDSLSAGTLTVFDGKTDGNGMICGRIAADSVITVDDVYAIKCKNPEAVEGAEKNWYASWGLTGYRTAPLNCTGPAVLLTDKYIKGFAAYQYTTLDFENYWAVDPDGHPVLKKFLPEGETAPDVSGYSKLADYSWYNSVDTDYYISNREQLVAMSLLSSGDPFTGKNINLTANITLNSGNAANWDNKAPAYEWSPIGSASLMFQGTFNGMGHTVKGLYISEPNNGVGMFGMIKNATIKNLRLTNSFVESTMASATKKDGKYSNYAYTGGIAGYAGKATFDTIYTDVIVKNDGEMTGGFVGLSNTVDHPITFNKCWFDGTIIQDYSVKKKDGSLGACFGAGFVGVLRNNSATINHCLSTGTFVAENLEDGTWGTVTAGFVARNDQTGKNTGGKLTITDSLANIKLKGYPNSIEGNGSVISQANPSTKLVLKDVYAVASLWPTIGANRTDNKDQTVTALILPKIEGANAYNWTTLNFKSYWNAIEGGAPVLKAFSSGKVAKEADKPADPYAYRTPDTSWYSEEQTEFVLTTANQLLGLAELSKTKDFAGRTVKLGADITFNYCLSSKKLMNGNNVSSEADTWTPIGTSVTPFRGVFDGQGYTISGLVDATTGQSGLFAYVDDAFIQNVTIARSSFRGGSGGGKAAAIAANTAGDTTIKRIMIADDVRLLGSSYAGGIVALNKGNLVIDNVWAAHYFNPQWVGGVRAGGIVAQNENSDSVSLTISNALYTGVMDGTVVGSGDNASIVGGIVGFSANKPTTTITDSVVSGNIKLLGVVSANDRTSSGFFGSVIGSKSWTVANTYTEDVYAISTSVHNVKWNPTGGEDKKGASESVGYHGAVRPDQAFASGVYVVERDTIVGDKAKTNASGLDYTNIWMTRSGKVPALRNPASGEATPAPITAPSNLEVDMSWYDKNATEYVLMDAADLNGFALLSGANSFKGKTVKLGADITLNTGNAADWATTAPTYEWAPIAKSTVFEGTFDGQGYTISGLYTECENDYAAFIAMTKGATVKNVKIVNSYFNAIVDGTYDATANFHTIAAIVGRANAGTTVESVYTDAILVGGKHAGLIGHTDDTAGAGVTVKNCWFDGAITVNVATDSRGSGGIIGQVVNSQTSTVENCLFTGTITGGANGTFVGGIVGMGPYNATINMTNCLSVGDMSGVTKGSYGSIIGNNPGANRSTYTNVFASADTCANMMGAGGATFTAHSVTTASILGNQATVTMSGFDYTDVWVTVENGTPELRTFSTSTGATDIPVADPNTLNTDWYNDTDTVFTISTLGEFKGFVKLANEGNNFAGKTIKLGADIAWNTGTASAWGSASPENVWTPIASFKGTLDGQGYTLSGLYYKIGGTANNGIFSVVENATIKNLVIANSHMESTAGSGNNGILAAVAKGVTVENVKIENTVSVLGATNTGMIGNAQGANTFNFKKVWMAGNVVNGMWTAQTGGLLAFADNTNGLVVNIEDCLFTGSIRVTHATSTATNYAGGFVGGLGADAKVNVKNVLSVGTISFANTSNANNLGGSVIGVSSWRGAAYAKFENAYAANETYKVGTHRDSSMITGTIIRVVKANLLGNLAKTNAPNLDYVNTWVTVDGGTPELREFSDSMGATDTPTTPDPSEPTPSDPNQETTAWFTGDKTEYVISTVGELKGFVTLSQTDTFSGITIKLGADIVWNTGNAADWATTAPGNVWNAIAQTNADGFMGTFDGNGHTISGLYYNGNGYAALIGRMYVTGTLKNIRIVNSYLKSTNGSENFHHSSGIVGRMNNGAKISDVYTDAILVAEKCAGMVAFNDGGEISITNCWFDGTINATNTTNAAGIVASLVNSKTHTITNCLFTGTITGGASGGYYGGIVGIAPYSATVKMTSTLSAGDMTGVTAGTVGSVVGNNPGGNLSIYTNVYATNETHTNLKGAGGATFPVTAFARAEILGAAAPSKLAGFDFVNVWVTVNNGTPELKKFSTSTGADPDPSTPPATGWYGDGTASEFTLNSVEDFNDFAAKVRSGNTFEGKTVKLGADIALNTGNAADWATTAPANVWTPMTTFKGTLDGQGYTISGLYYNNATGNKNLGLFETVEKATIKNLVIANSRMASTTGSGNNGIIAAIAKGVTVENVTVAEDVTITGNTYTGMIAYANGTNALNFKNVWMAGTITNGMWTARVGGLLGFTENVEGLVITVDTCLFTGTVRQTHTTTSAECYVGGFVGATPSKVKMTIKNSLSAGTVSKATTSTNCYTGSVVGISSSGGASFTTFEKVYATNECYSIVNNRPAYTGTITKVAKADLLGELAKTNAPELDYTNSWTTVAGKTPELSYFTPAVDTTEKTTAWYDSTKTEYTISTVGELKGLVELSATNDFAGKTIKLGNDIVWNSGNAADWATTAPANAWTPIGTVTLPFKGSFNGQGHTVSGLYYKATTRACGGLFGYTDGATIENLTVANSYLHAGGFYANTTVFTGVGTVAGYANNTTFRVIHVDSDVILTAGQDMGGIAGQINGKTSSVFEQCWFSGTIKLESAPNSRAGGIYGFGNSNAVNIQLTNCLFDGVITGAVSPSSGASYAGGLFSMGNYNNSGVITNCLVAGTVDATTSSGTGSITALTAGGGGLQYVNVYYPAGTTYMSNPTKMKDVSTTYDVERTALLGNAAKTTLVGFDFTDVWAVVEDSTPALKAFVPTTIGG